MKNKKDKEEFSPKDQLSSTPTDMFQLEHMKTSDSINPSPNNNSKTKSVESEDFDLQGILLFIQFFFLMIIL